MPSSTNESVWLADRNAENPLKNSLTAYRADVGVKTRGSRYGRDQQSTN